MIEEAAEPVFEKAKSTCPPPGSVTSTNSWDSPIAASAKLLPVIFSNPNVTAWAGMTVHKRIVAIKGKISNLFIRAPIDWKKITTIEKFFSHNYSILLMF
ncbi:MAG: hypothetical protein GTO24_09985 [candidate division Zixibacteria bacterium]|nr:hypothetical protein [candidate division Zixibacteria bacterium]